MKDAMGDKGDDGAARSFWSFAEAVGKYGKDMESTFRGDADMTSKIEDFKKTRPDLAGDDNAVKLRLSSLNKQQDIQRLLLRQLQL